MARSLKSQKRMRQNAKRAEQNRGRSTALKSSIRKASEAISAKDAGAEKALRAAVKAIDQGAARGTLHKNTAARRKSRLMRMANSQKSGK